MKECHLCLDNLSRSLRRNGDSFAYGSPYDMHKYSVKKSKGSRSKRLNSYHKQILDALARRFEGEELLKRLSELKFCTVETALQYYADKEVRE